MEIGSDTSDKRDQRDASFIILFSFYLLGLNAPHSRSDLPRHGPSLPTPPPYGFRNGTGTGPWRDTGRRKGRYARHGGEDRKVHDETKAAEMIAV